MGTGILVFYTAMVVRRGEYERRTHRVHRGPGVVSPAGDAAGLGGSLVALAGSLA